LELEAQVRELSAENNILKKRVNTQHRVIEIGFIRLRAEKSETEKWKSLAGYSVDPFSYRAVPQWQEEPAAHNAHAEISRLESHLERQDNALHSSRQEIHRLEEVVEEKETKITMLNNKIEQWQTRDEQVRTFVEGLVFRYNLLEKHCVNPVTTHQQLADECFSLRHENQNMQLHLEYSQNQYNALLTDRNNLHALCAARENDLREAIDEYSELDAQKYNLQVANSKLEAEKRQLKVVNTRLSVQKRKMKVATTKRTAKFRKLKADIQAQAKKLDAKRKSIKTCLNKVLGQMKNDECDSSRSGEKPQAELRDCQTANESSDGADFFEHIWAPLPQPLPESYRVYRSHEEDDIDEDDEDEEPRNDGGVRNLVSLIDMLMLEDEMDLIT
jgi:septal ring factor EnvC (AmiA/AmiB activator)